MGLKEHIVFPEINYDQIDQIWGMDIIVCTTAQDRRRSAGAAQGIQVPVPAVTAASKEDSRQWLRRAPSRRTNAAASSVDAVRRASARALKAIANDETLPLEERFEARLKLAELPRNSSTTRIRNRCEVTGRPRAYYRKLKMTRIALRELGSPGPDPRPRQVELVRRSDR